MPWFYVDDAFADSKPVMRLDERLRNEAIGLWVRCGAWSAKEETDGRVPISVVRQFGGTARTVRALHEQAELWTVEDLENWRKNREILFRNWTKWQKSREENVARRKREAEKKSTYRASKKGRDYVATSEDPEMSTGDNTVDTELDSEDVSTGDRAGESLYPDPTRPITTTHLGNESSPNVGVERGLTDPIAPSASRLVAALIPDTIPAAVRTSLRIHASQLMNRDGLDADTTAEVLRRWLNRPGAGPGLLPSLASDVIRERATPAANVHQLSAFERKKANNAAVFQALATTPEQPELLP